MARTQEEYRQILEQRLDEAGFMKKVGYAAAGLAATAGIGLAMSNMGGSKPAYDPQDAEFDRIEQRQDAAVKNMQSNPNNLRKKTANGEVWSNQPLNSNGSVNLGAGGSNAQNRALPSTSTAPLRTRGVPSGQGVQMDANDM
jgi:hypothetical protein